MLLEETIKIIKKILCFLLAAFVTVLHGVKRAVYVFFLCLFFVMDLTGSRCVLPAN